MTQQGGLYVVATGFTTSLPSIELGRNNAGYCNVIIVRNRFNDGPTTGGTERTLSYFGGSLAQEESGGSPGNYLDGLAAILDQPTTTQTNCALINTSRQTNFVLRIITRDMDSTSNIRPDNV
jgi:hypothetical protein